MLTSLRSLPLTSFALVALSLGFTGCLDLLSLIAPSGTFSRTWGIRPCRVVSRLPRVVRSSGGGPRLTHFLHPLSAGDVDGNTNKAHNVTQVPKDFLLPPG